MAKNYKRHAQGQGFKRANFGDMGLRAYREQQKTIIDGMKLQAAQAKASRDEFLSGDIQKSRKELENRAELKNFEDEVWDNKHLNEKIRADREIEQLEQRAKEEEEKAQFWKDFSTTYSHQLYKGAKGIHDAIDLKSAQRDFDTSRSDGRYNTAITQSKFLNNANQSDIKNYLHNLYSDKEKSGHYKRTQTAWSEDIEQRRSSNYNRITADQLIEDSDKIVTHLFRTLSEEDEGSGRKPLEITKDNVRGLIEGRALEIMAELGMDPNSEGGRKFLEHMWDTAGDKEFEKYEQYWAKQDDMNLNGKQGILADIKASKGDPIDFELAFNRGINHFRYRYVIGEDDKASLSELDVKQAYLGLSELLINRGIITDIDQLNLPYPGQPIHPDEVLDPTKGKRKLMLERHPDLKDDLEKLLLAKDKQDIAQDNEKRDTADEKALAQLKVDVEARKYDLNNLDDITVLETANSKHTKTMEFINKAKTFNPKLNETNGYLVNEKINAAYENNDYEAYMDTMQYQSQDDQKQFATLTKQLDELNANGGSNKLIREWAEGTIKAELKVSNLNDFKHASASDIDETMIQDFYFEYRKVDNDYETLSPRAKIDAAKKAVLEKFKNQTGIYRRTGESNSTVFHGALGYADATKGMDMDTLDTKIKEGWDNLFAEAESDPELEILDQDYIDLQLLNIINGDLIDQNDIIDELYLTQPVRGEGMLTKTQILNKILKSKGIKTLAPPGPDELAEYTVRVSDVNISNYNRMSDENKTRMRILLETGKLPVAKDTSTVIKDAEVRSNFIKNHPVTAFDLDYNVQTKFSKDKTTQNDFPAGTKITHSNKKDKDRRIGDTKKGPLGNTLVYSVISGSNTKKHLGWKNK